ncbi:MAG: 50S ribosomal protein L15 [Proteobacteria bacterium]|nr:50S ribosomal protein L15 [Pseudomonadota bacterium]
MTTLNQLSDNKGARATRNRVGRGIGSGNGKTSGRGGKGQTARSGGSIMPGFEGGQTPLYRRLPIRGFNNHNFTTNYMVMNVADLQRFSDAGRLDGIKVISAETLKAAGIIQKSLDGLKILGNGELKAKLTIEAAAASASAAEKVKKAGGTLTIKSPKEGINKFLPKAALKRMAAAKA